MTDTITSQNIDLTSWDTLNTLEWFATAECEEVKAKMDI
jgi:hypothetical protein